jgi:hypothetical protein
MYRYVQAYSWGFGGYGRLGHAETGDELVPRIIKFLDQKNRGVRSLSLFSCVQKLC